MAILRPVLLVCRFLPLLKHKVDSKFQTIYRINFQILNPKKDLRNFHMLQQMYNELPFYRVTIKKTSRIAALYGKLLVSEELWSFGERLRSNYEETRSLLLQVHKKPNIIYVPEVLKVPPSPNTCIPQTFLIKISANRNDFFNIFRSGQRLNRNGMDRFPTCRSES